MATLDETLAKVTETRGRVASLATLTAGIKARLDEILAGALTPEQQAKVDAVFAEVDAAKADVDAAINGNDDDPNT